MEPRKFGRNEMHRTISVRVVAVERGTRHVIADTSN